jgi:hypothetical protein
VRETGSQRHWAICEGDRLTEGLGICEGGRLTEALGICEGDRLREALGICEGNQLTEALGICEGDRLSQTTTLNSIRNSTLISMVPAAVHKLDELANGLGWRSACTSVANTWGIYNSQRRHAPSPPAAGEVNTLRQTRGNRVDRDI